MIPQRSTNNPKWSKNPLKIVQNCRGLGPSFRLFLGTPGGSERVQNRRLEGGPGHQNPPRKEVPGGSERALGARPFHGRSWGRAGNDFGPILGPSWGGSWGPCWTFLAMFWSAFRVTFFKTPRDPFRGGFGTQLGPQIGPKRLQNPVGKRTQAHDEETTPKWSNLGPTWPPK